MGWLDDIAEIAELKGKTLLSVQQIGDDIIDFKCSDGTNYRMYHEQDGVESVTVEDIIGDLQDLIGEPLLEAEEVSSDERPDDLPEQECRAESESWTFYKLATRKANVTIRWHGASNGHYSESVRFKRMP